MKREGVRTWGCGEIEVVDEKGGVGGENGVVTRNENNGKLVGCSDLGRHSL